MNRIHHIRQLGLVLSPVLLLAEGILRARRACGQQQHRGQDEAQPADAVDVVHG